MRELRRPPTRTEQIVAALATFLLTGFFSVLAVALWRDKEPQIVAAMVVSALALLCATLFIRATFTSRRAVSERTGAGLATFLLVFGICSLVLALGFATGTDRLSLLAAGLGCIGYGLAGRARQKG